MSTRVLASTLAHPPCGARSSRAGRDDLLFRARDTNMGGGAMSASAPAHFDYPPPDPRQSKGAHARREAGALDRTPLEAVNQRGGRQRVSENAGRRSPNWSAPSPPRQSPPMAENWETSAIAPIQFRQRMVTTSLQASSTVRLFSAASARTSRKGATDSPEVPIAHLAPPRLRLSSSSLVH